MEWAHPLSTAELRNIPRLLKRANTAYERICEREESSELEAQWALVDRENYAWMFHASLLT